MKPAQLLVWLAVSLPIAAQPAQGSVLPKAVPPKAAPSKALLPKAKAPFIAGDGAGGFFVSHVVDGTLKVAHVRDGKWGPAKTIASENLFVNSADVPTIAVDGRRLLASWPTRNGHGTVIHLAESADGGATWKEAKTPHPNMVSQFGFVSLLPKDAVFLDGRKLKGGIEGEGDMELRTPDALLDGRVCDCCQTAAVMTSAGAVVAYRDRSDKEMRDISIVRQTAKGWTQPKLLHADGWEIQGCPVNGPQLDARGKQVVAAWFTAAQNDPRVQVAFSKDAAATFAAPVRVTTGKTMGRVDVAWLDAKNVVVTWVAEGALYARRVSLGGAMSAPMRIATAGGFPRMAVSKENVAVVWTADDGVHFQMIEGLS